MVQQLDCGASRNDEAGDMIWSPRCDGGMWTPAFAGMTNRGFVGGVGLGAGVEAEEVGVAEGEGEADALAG